MSASRLLQSASSGFPGSIDNFEPFFKPIPTQETPSQQVHTFTPTEKKLINMFNEFLNALGEEDINAADHPRLQPIIKRLEEINKELDLPQGMQPLPDESSLPTLETSPVLHLKRRLLKKE